MQSVLATIKNLTDVQTTVLITGESGTGKELVAEAIHEVGIYIPARRYINPKIALVFCGKLQILSISVLRILKRIVHK